MKKQGAFTVPPLDEIRVASKIRVENTPSVFEPSRPTRSELQAKEGGMLAREEHVLSSKSAVLNTGSLQETTTPSSYHPHAIIATGQQVSRAPLTLTSLAKATLLDPQHAPNVEILPRMPVM